MFKKNKLVTQQNSEDRDAIYKEAKRHTKKIKSNLLEIKEELGDFGDKLRRAERIVNKMRDKKKYKKKKEKQMEKAEAVNEGEVTVEEVFRELEKYRANPQPLVQGWEAAREHYNKSQEKLEEHSNKLKELEALLDAFENKVQFLTGGKVTKEDCQKFREASNEISVWFGRYAAVLQYTAASGVVFTDLIKKHEGTKH